MLHKAIAVAFLSSVLSSCASVHFYKVQPEKMYEGARPLSDTAVFSAHDELSSLCPLGADVQMVDGEKTSRWAFPMWVRVTPGAHSFVIHCTIKSYLGWHTANAEYVSLDVKVQDMKPRHVYVARYDQAAGKIEATVDDMGENSYYSIKLPGQFVKPEF